MWLSHTKFFLHCQTTLIACEESQGFSAFKAASLNLYFFMVLQLLVGQGLLMFETSRSHSDTPHTVGLPLTSEESVAQTSTWQHTTLTTDRLPCPPAGFEHTISKKKKRTAADSRLRPRGHRVRLNFVVICLNIYCFSLRKRGSVSVTRNNRLMLSRKIITFYCIIRNK